MWNDSKQVKNEKRIPQNDAAQTYNFSSVPFGKVSR